MGIAIEEIKRMLKEKGLKVTPQRMTVLTVIHGLNNHPRAENIIAEARQKYPSIAVGTIYRILEMFVNTGIVRKVKSEHGVARYDCNMKHHHHLYCDELDLIEDYEDEELDTLLETYFRNKEIVGCRIEEMSLQIKVVKKIKPNLPLANKL